MSNSFFFTSTKSICPSSAAASACRPHAPSKPWISCTVAFLLFAVVISTNPEILRVDTNSASDRWMAWPMAGNEVAHDNTGSVNDRPPPGTSVFAKATRTASECW